MAGLLDFIGQGARGVNGLLGGFPGQVAVGANGLLGGIPGQVGGMGLHELQALGLLSQPQMAQQFQPQQAPSYGGIGNDFAGTPSQQSMSVSPAPNVADNAGGSVDAAYVNAGPAQAPQPKLPMPAQNYIPPTVADMHPSLLGNLGDMLLHGRTWGEADLHNRQLALAPAVAQFQANQMAQRDALYGDPTTRANFRMDPTGQLANERAIALEQSKPMAVGADQKLGVYNPASGKTTFASPYGDGPRYEEPVMKNGVPQKWDNATQTWVKAEGLTDKDRFEMNRQAQELDVTKQKQNVDNANALFSVPQFEAHQTSASLFNDLAKAAKQPGGVSDAVIREAVARIATSGKATQFSSNMFDKAGGPLAQLSQYAPMLLSGQTLTPQVRQAMLEFAHDKATQDKQAFIKRVSPIIKAYKDNGLPTPDVVGSLTDIPDVPAVGQIPRGMGVPKGHEAEPAKPARSAPPAGFVSKGWRFKGGDPSQPSSWEPVR
jgi:hypothetical protein